MPIAARIYGVQAGEPASTIVLATFFLYFRIGGQLGIGAYSAAGEYVGALGVTSAREVVGASIYPEPVDGLGQGTRIGCELTDGVNSDRLVTLDLYGTRAEYLYTAPAGWFVSAPQKVGPSIYWFEWQPLESSGTTELRLVRSDSAKWTDPTVLRTVTVNSTILSNSDWASVRGPDFTTSQAGIWLEVKGEISTWERVVIALGGSSHSQRPVGVDGVSSVLRAGHPLGSKSLTQTSSDVAPPESAELPIVEWSGSVGADYEPFAGVSAVDIAPDPGGSGIWLLRGAPLQIEHRSTTGALLESIALQEASGAVVGLHVLETPIAIEVVNQGAGEGE